MTVNEINRKLRCILQKDDCDRDSIITRCKSVGHESDTEVLIENISILISDLRFNLEATRRELFQAKSLLEKE